MEYNNLSTKKLLELSETIINTDCFMELKAFSDINTFKDKMLISQVVRFFNNYEKNFTKTMIQNYVRVGLLPPPFEKRYYTKNHLILLALIDNLKSIYSLEELKNILSPILKDPLTFEDDTIKVGDLYKEHIKLYYKSLENWKSVLPDTLKDINKTIVKIGINETEIDTSSAFLLVLILMSQTVALKRLSKVITEKFLT